MNLFDVKALNLYKGIHTGLSFRGFWWVAGHPLHKRDETTSNKTKWGKIHALKIAQTLNYYQKNAKVPTK